MVWNVVVRLVGAALLGLAGWQVGGLLADALGAPGFFIWGLVGTVAGALAGALAVPYIAVWPVRTISRVLQSIPSSRLLAGTIGLVLGLLVAVLVSAPVARIPGWTGIWLPVALSALFAVLGVLVTLGRERDLLPFLPQNAGRPALAGRGDAKILVDTSAIIDGRIADISQTGFFHGTLVIPRFILDELRHIADSSDSLRRNRGRRGLEMLNKLRKEVSTPVQVLDVDGASGMEVDSKLVKLAKSLGAPIITTDFNLNRVAEIQGVQVLNINELANALKSVVLPGEELQVRVIQEGKEMGQGVGFLDDGTMVVVESGRRFLNTQVDVMVTRVLQTAAGRLIFAQPKTR